MIKSLRNKKLYVLDMDGTFYLGESILKGSLDFIKRLTDSGRDFLFFTNNSSKSSGHYIKKLGGMGLTIDRSHIATSGDVTISYLKNNYPDKKVYLLGTAALVQDFSDKGIRLVDEAPDIVVLGFDTTLDYNKITKACTFIKNGSMFFATHPDFNCPVENGFLPDCGAMCAMFTASTGVKPKYFGKPNNETLAFILEKTGLASDDIVFVGDRLMTDIAIGYRNGATSILVLTGETRESDLAHSDVKPDFVYPSLNHIDLEG